MTHNARLLLGVCALAATIAGGQNWSRFRGPAGSGKGEGHIPTTWSEWQHVRWKTPLPGKGWSSPIVLGNQLWMTTALNAGRSLRALCVALDSGTLVHNVEVLAPATPETVHNVNSHATPTPAVEAGRVYVSFGNQGLACLDARNGDTLWVNRDLRLNHKEGAGSSPILWRDLLILDCDGIDVQYIVAVDKMSGREVWRSERSAPFEGVRSDLRKAYGTPVVLTVGDETHLISCGARRFYGYDPTNGDERWVVDHQGYNCNQTPVMALGNVLLGTSFNRGNLMAVRLTPGMSGNVSATHAVWTLQRDVPRMPSPLVFGNRIFLINDGGVASWVDAASGRQLWRDKILGKVFASPVAAGDHIVAFDDAGRSVVLERGEPPRTVAVNSLEQGCMATPAIVGNSIIVRTKTHLYRIQQR